MFTLVVFKIMSYCGNRILQTLDKDDVQSTTARKQSVYVLDGSGIMGDNRTHDDEATNIQL